MLIVWLGSAAALAFALWMAYGLLLRQWPLVASNVICFVLASFILMMKLLPDSATRHVSRKLGGRAQKR